MVEMQRIRHRLMSLGELALSEGDLVALVVGQELDPSSGGTPEEPQRGLGLRELLRSGAAPELADRLGLAEDQICALKAALELGRRLVAPCPVPGKPISSSVDVAEWYRAQLQDLDQENVHVLLLDAKHRVVRMERIAEGAWNNCLVDPKVVFSLCLRHRAPAVILVHNHPSGDPSPSQEDLALTERLGEAGQLLDIRLLDHLIVGRAGFFSFVDAGLL